MNELMNLFNEILELHRKVSLKASKALKEGDNNLFFDLFEEQKNLMYLLDVVYRMIRGEERF